MGNAGLGVALLVFLLYAVGFVALGFALLLRSPSKRKYLWLYALCILAVVLWFWWTEFS
jgi:hypothetical protein